MNSIRGKSVDSSYYRLRYLKKMYSKNIKNNEN